MIHEQIVNHDNTVLEFSHVRLFVSRNKRRKKKFLGDSKKKKRRKNDHGRVLLVLELSVSEIEKRKKEEDRNLGKLQMTDE